LKNRHHPTEVGWVTHRSVKGDKESFELREVVALVVPHVFDVDITDMSLDRSDIRSFVGVAAVRDGAIEIAAGYPGEGEKPLVLCGQGAGGKGRNRRRIQSPAKHATHRGSPAPLPPPPPT